MLEFNDIQSGVLRPRPTPYAGTYIMLRIDDRAAGHQLLKRLTPAIASATDLTSPAGDAWVAVALSSHGLKALGVPQASLESFSPEFQQGMAARAAELGDVGESAPEKWEWPLGTSEVHLVIAALAPDQTRLAKVLSPRRSTGRTAINFPRGANHSAFGTPSANRRSRGAVLLGAIPRKLRSRRGSLSWGISTSRGGSLRSPSPRCWAATGRMWP